MSKKTSVPYSVEYLNSEKFDVRQSTFHFDLNIPLNIHFKIKTKTKQEDFNRNYTRFVYVVAAGGRYTSCVHLFSQRGITQVDITYNQHQIRAKIS